MTDLSIPVDAAHDASPTRCSHVKPGDPTWRSDGPGDLGVAEATNARVIAHLVKANMAPEKGAGWHRHEADVQIVVMPKGGARFMYGGPVTLLEAGGCICTVSAPPDRIAIH